MIVVTFSHAQDLATVPTYHWSYQYLQRLALRHREAGMTFERLPFVSREAFTFMKAFNQTEASSAEKFWAERLREYFMATEQESAVLQIGGRVLEKGGKLEGASRSRTAVLTHLGFFPNRHLGFVNAIRVDQELRDDPNYLGKRWRGFAGYTEQAYALLHFEKYMAKFGRDFLWWGRGYDATLLLSDYSRPRDQFYGRMSFNKFRLHYLAAKLDPITLPDSLQGSPVLNFAERYLSAVRAEIVFNPRILTVAATQMAVYGGAQRGFEWYYLNPLLIYHGEQVNEQRKSNTFLAFDFTLRPRNNAELYGQLLIDDYQVERTGKRDLEPSEIGYLLGGEIAEPFKLTGASLGVEYTRVANRTYNALAAWEKFTHRNRPLAHFLGNDFDRWLVHGHRHFGANIELNAVFETRRRGEGRIDSTFDQPWLEVAGEQNYSEKFPSGVIERSKHLQFELRWHPSAAFYLSINATHSRYRDFEHQAGIDKTENSFFVKLWLEKMWLVEVD
ncbi:hypothetical protein HUU05_01690 [candidate division KSB1 bacterium]|nr:hypothetical protein [candidate division KSB1 bacterium]